MKNYRVFLFSCITISLAFTGAGQSLPPGHSTECMSNSGSPACQNPVYTDDLSEYLYDLRTSWTFNNGAPDDSGPTIFEGGSAGNLKTQQNDSVSGSDKTEYFIQNPGEADTYSFGRGSLQNNNIQITGSKKGSNPIGEYLINPPYKAQCGDGKIDPGETTSNCPEDLGTPKQVDITSFTPSKTIQFDETGSYSHSIATGSPALSDIVKDTGTSSGSPDYHANGSYIVKDTVPTQNLKIGNATHKYVADGLSNAKHYSDTTAQGDFFEPKVGKSNRTVCRGPPKTNDTSYVSKPLPIRTDKTFKHSGPEKKYTAVDNYQSGTTEVEVTYTSGMDTSFVEKWRRCPNTQKVGDGCDSSKTGTQNCDYYDIDNTYYPVQNNNENLYFIGNSSFDVFVTDLYIQRQKAWGPVNQKPGLFSGLDVADTPYGYHTVPDNDGRQGSNDESVSANKYTIASKNNKFIAQRIASHVADADGPDGQGDGLIAYNDKQDKIKARTGPVMKTEHWDNNQIDYINKFDLPDLKCPGDTIRCLKSVDFSTKPSGWGTNPGNSFKTDLKD